MALRRPKGGSFLVAAKLPRARRPLTQVKPLPGAGRSLAEPRRHLAPDSSDPLVNGHLNSPVLRSPSVLARLMGPLSSCSSGGNRCGWSQRGARLEQLHLRRSIPRRRPTSMRFAGFLSIIGRTVVAKSRSLPILSLPVRFPLLCPHAAWGHTLTSLADPKIVRGAGLDLLLVSWRRQFARSMVQLAAWCYAGGADRGMACSPASLSR